MDVNIVVELSDKEIRDYIMAAAKEKIKAASGGSTITVDGDLMGGGRGAVHNMAATVKFQYKQH